MANAKPVLLGLILSILPVGTALAQAPRPGQITVTGSAEVRALPDQTQVSAGVTSEAPDPQSALAKNDARMAAVFAALAKAGIPRSAIHTSELSLFPQYGTAPNRNEQVQGYRASNTVTVTLPNTLHVGSVLDELVKAGANHIEGIRFMVSNPAPYLAKARTEAVRAALRAAQTYASAAGIRLGPIQSISAGIAQPPQPILMRSMAAAETPVAPEAQRVQASVTISWSIR
ncbi:MAG: SIMPL domain-containing protein [Alphaproteobacteria bacterium]|nr:SIMPL domain-containing protein [Alphaproteobacteria bacterium]